MDVEGKAKWGHIQAPRLKRWGGVAGLMTLTSSTELSPPVMYFCPQACPAVPLCWCPPQSVSHRSAGSRCPADGLTPLPTWGTCGWAPADRGQVELGTDNGHLWNHYTVTYSTAVWPGSVYVGEAALNVLLLQTVKLSTLTFLSSAWDMLRICSLVQNLSSSAAWEFWGLCQLPPLQYILQVHSNTHMNSCIATHTICTSNFN